MGGTRLKYFVAVLFCSALIFDGFRLPITEKLRWSSEIQKPTNAILKLRDLDDGAVAHFPWELSSEDYNYPTPTPCLLFLTHLHPVINSCGLNYSSTDRFPILERIRSLSPCEQLTYMQNIGVKYLLVEAKHVQPELMNCLKNYEAKGKFTPVISSDTEPIDLWGLYPLSHD